MDHLQKPNLASIFKARKASMVPRNALRAGCVCGARPAAVPRGAVMQVTWRGGGGETVVELGSPS